MSGASVTASTAPRFSVTAIEFFERDVRLRMPFRFGVVTLTEAPQVFARARIRLADGTEAVGIPPNCWRPSGSTKTRRCPTKTTSTSCAQRWSSPAGCTWPVVSAPHSVTSLRTTARRSSAAVRAA